MMKKSHNKETQKRFDVVAENFWKLSNIYSVKRRYESLQLDSKDVLLEVGSGPGFITKHFTGKVVCTDVSYQMCKHAKIYQPLVVCCDAEKLPFTEKSFDAIISSEMIHYLQHPENLISNASMILKKNGKFLISMANHEMSLIPKIRSMLRILGIKGMYFDDGDPKLINLEHLISVLKKHGFHVKSVNKIVIFPFYSFDKLNRILEKTTFGRFGILTILRTNLEISKT